MDYVEYLAELLETNWNANNTDGITPNIIPIYKLKVMDWNIALKRDLITIYQVSRTETPTGIGYPAISAEDTLTVDIRTTYKDTVDAGRQHANKLLNEVKRIIYADRKDYNGLNADYMKITTIRDLSDRTIRLWRFVIDISVVKFVEAL